MYEYINSNADLSVANIVCSLPFEKKKEYYFLMCRYINENYFINIQHWCEILASLYINSVRMYTIYANLRMVCGGNLYIRTCSSRVAFYVQVVCGAWCQHV